MEIWKTITGLEMYQISNTGLIKSAYTDNLISTFVRKSGYVYAGLFKDNKPAQRLLHRLVAFEFVPNPDAKPCVNHLDGNKENNNDWNLAWATYSENNKHAYDIGLMDIHGEKHMHAKLTDKKVLKIRQVCRDRDDIRKFAVKYGVSPSTVYDALTKRTWTHI